MKKVLFIFILFCIGYSAFGQYIDTVDKYYKSGKLKFRYIDSDFNADTTYSITTNYYKTGGVKWRSIYVHFKDTAYLHDTEYYENGKKKEEYSVGYYKKRPNHLVGVLEGNYYLYSDSGIIKQIVHYSRGKRNGESFTFFENGDTDKVVLFKNGHFMGNPRQYFRNGKLRMLATLLNDSIISMQTFDFDGNPIPQTQVVNGNGEVMFCNEDGTLCCHCEVIHYKAKHCQPVESWEKKKARKRRKTH